MKTRNPTNETRTDSNPKKNARFEPNRTRKKNQNSNPNRTRLFATRHITKLKWNEKRISLSSMISDYPRLFESTPFEMIIPMKICPKN